MGDDELDVAGRAEKEEILEHSGLDVVFHKFNQSIRADEFGKIDFLRVC